MSKVKAGDLCYVSGKASTPGLAGRIITVLRRHTDPDELFATDGGFIRVIDTTGAWVCTSPNPLPWLTSGPAKSVVFAKERVIDETVLIPINGGDAEDSTEKTLELEGSF